MDLKKVCVILPCHNEEVSLKHTVSQIWNVSKEIEILVVDNASTDKTSEVALNLGLKVVSENKKGKGFAVRKGFSNLDKTVEIIVLVDADDTYDLSNLKSALSLVSEKGYDMAVGTRVQKDIDFQIRSKAFRQGHKVGNYLLSKLSEILHPSGIKDSLSGYRIFSRNFIDSFTGNASGFEIEAEINAHTSFMNLTVANFDVAYRGRREGSISKLNTYKDGFKILIMNFKIFRTYRPKLSFSILSLAWLGISLCLMTNPITTYFETGLVPRFPSLIAGIGAFIIAVQLWNTGMILDRIKITHLSQCRVAYNSSKNYI
jgi:glycosyltransferase involved in cell wall biosynthesis